MNILYYLAAKIPASDIGVEKLSADDVIAGVLKTVYYAAGITAVIVIIIAGIFYTTSDGDAAKTKRAREAIIYASVGLVVIIMAFIITSFIVGRF